MYFPISINHRHVTYRRETSASHMMKRFTLLAIASAQVEFGLQGAILEVRRWRSKSRKAVVLPVLSEDNKKFGADLADDLREL